jgi:hypothetical protein
MNNVDRSINKHEALIFLHIPKTAGTTLMSILDRQYKPGAIFSTYGNAQEAVDKFKTFSESQRMNIRVLKGHIPFGVHTFLPQPSHYFTILRDPIDRIISHYYFVLETTSHYLHDRVTSQNMTLKDYVSNGIATRLDNGQTRIISGVGDTVGFGQCSPEMLETAKKHLRGMPVVGLSERFDETVILLKRNLGWKLPFYMKANVTKNRPGREDISKDTIAVIERYNELDFELYKYAQELFEELIRQQPPAFERELKRFRFLNKFFGSHYLILKLRVGRFLFKNYLKDPSSSRHPFLKEN